MYLIGKWKWNVQSVATESGCLALVLLEEKMRRTSLVDVRLAPNKGDRVQIMPIGDIHYGARTCDEDMLLNTIAECVRRKIYVVGMGDMLEISIVGSVGGPFGQLYTPEKQMEKMIEILQPLADAGLLLGIHDGNHENRISKMTSINVTGFMCKMLGVPYLGHSAFHLWKVGKQSYTAHSTHGSSGARLPYSKVKAALDVFRYVEAEMVLYGHLHGLDHLTQMYYRVNKTRKMAEECARHAILTGSFLNYKDSYAERMNLPPVQTGTAIISLWGDKHKIHVSV
jgi:hypothetical protein